MKNDNKLLKTFSSLANRLALSRNFGQQYGGDRDVYEALGYPDTITYEEYSSRYLRQDIAAAIINRPAEATWRGPLEVSESQDDQTQFERAFDELNKRLNLKQKFTRLDKLSNIGEYGALLLGLSDVGSVEDWRREVQGKPELMYVKPLGQASAEINTYETNTRDPRYGMPKTYNCTLTTPGDNSTTTLIVHYTRVMHVTGELLESEIKGTPRLEAVWNRLMDLEKLVGGSAEMFWRGARPGFQGKIDDDYVMDDATEEDLQDQIDEYEHKLRRIFMLKGVELEALETQVSDPSKHVDVQIQMISARTGIPKRILTGSERGELSSSQDRDAWLELVQTRREEFAEQQIVHPFVELCVKYGVLPKPGNEWTVKWNDLFAPSEKEKSEVGKTRATALKEYAQNPEAQMIVPPEAFFDMFLGLNDEQRDTITEMMDEAIREEERFQSEEE